MRDRNRWAVYVSILQAIILSILIISPSSASAIAKAEFPNTYVAGEVIPVNYYSTNGTGVNPTAPNWGATETLLGRLAPATHDAGAEWMGLSDLPNPREISNTVCAQPGVIDDEMGLSDFNWLWGQFITHEIDFTLTQNGRVGFTGDPEHADIDIAEDDPVMGAPGGSKMLVFRSLYVNQTDDNGTVIGREHPNSITTWIDGSTVYGSSQARSDWLRTFEDGRLKVSEWAEGDLLPIAEPEDDTAPAMSFAGFSADERFVAGDARANEHIALMTLHVLFMREHNRLAEEIKERNPDWTDEEIYQRARKLVAAQIQVITYEEFLPSLGINLAPFEEFNASVDPTVTSAFATVAFRMGHSQIGDTFLRAHENRTSAGHMSLFDGFWTTAPVTQEGGISPLIRGMAMSTQPANDVYYGEDLRNHLFGHPGAGGMDLCAIDIQRGRDHGVADYGTMREALGLEPITNYSQITSNSDISTSLSVAYGDDAPGHIDPLIGMLAEDHIPNSVLGETMDALITDQFVRLRDGDPFYYENDAELTEVKIELKTTHLADIILRNTEIESIQCDVFFAEHNVNNLDCHLANAEMSEEIVEEEGFSTLILGLILVGVTGLLIMNYVGAKEAEEEE
ncbi:MAG: peroxidase family protein [Candidatus Thalassarchaeaceae archaeon]|jgi:hypothetical protein|nr:peroxidase family protein [Candidatus Thalassarchaeaceae archaeon]